MAGLMELAAERDLAVVEDAAQAAGARLDGAPAGSQAEHLHGVATHEIRVISCGSPPRPSRGRAGGGRTGRGRRES